MAIATLLTIWAAMLAAGDTPIGRWLRTIFVVRPAAGLDRIGRGQVAFVVLVLVIGVAVFSLGGEDGLRLVSLASPDVLAWAATVEMTTYLDLAVTAVLAASSLRLKGFRPAPPRCIMRRVGRAARCAHRQRPRISSNDDGEARHRLAA